MKQCIFLVLLLSLPKPSSAAETRLDETIARNARALSAVRAGYQETPLDDLVGKAMMAATRADAALLPTVTREARLAEGPITRRDLIALVPTDERLLVAPMTGGHIRRVLERAAGRFALYEFGPEQALFEPGQPDSAMDQFQGLSYELDLTRPAGERVVHLFFQGESLATERTLNVAVSQRRVDRGESELANARAGASPISLHDAVLAHVQGLGTWTPDFERSWSVLPDYAPCLERPLIDALVRESAIPPADVLRLFPDEPARRGDLAYWLSRAFGWRQRKLSGAFPDVPDSLEVWLDGLVRHRVLDTATRTSEFFLPFGYATLPVALEWCGNAMRSLRGAPKRSAEESRALLLAGTSIGGSSTAPLDTLTRAQALGMVSNARFPSARNRP